MIVFLAAFVGFLALVDFLGGIGRRKRCEPCPIASEPVEKKACQASRLSSCSIVAINVEVLKSPKFLRARKTKFQTLY